MEPNDAAASRRRNDRTARALSIVVIVALCAITALSLLAVKQVRDLSDCVARYNQQFSQSYQARLAASSEASQKLDDVITAVEKKDAARFRGSVAAYVDASDKQRAQAIKSPYPPLPESFCGEVRR